MTEQVALYNDLAEHVREQMTEEENPDIFKVLSVTDAAIKSLTDAMNQNALNQVIPPAPVLNITVNPADFPTDPTSLWAQRHERMLQQLYDLPATADIKGARIQAIIKNDKYYAVELVQRPIFDKHMEGMPNVHDREKAWELWLKAAYSAAGL